MAYFTDYYTNYFDVEVAAAEEPRRFGGGYWPTQEEWQRHIDALLKANQSEHARFLERKRIREELNKIPIPAEPEARIELAVAKAAIVEKTETRFHFRKVEDADLRADMAKVLRELKNRYKKLRQKRRDEEALLVLWDG